jgi:hypothetical protein
VSHADDDNHAAILMPRSQVQFRAAILIKTMSLIFQPMPLLKRAAAFDDDHWLFELKYAHWPLLSMAVLICYPATGIRSLPSLHWSMGFSMACRVEM